MRSGTGHFSRRLERKSDEMPCMENRLVGNEIALGAMARTKHAILTADTRTDDNIAVAAQAN